jgi:hypothetical protein
LSQYEWKKPVICIFRERKDKDHWESDPFVVIKAKNVTITQKSSSEFNGKIENFFTLMGDVDYLLSTEGVSDHYVLCWFDDREPDMTKDLRRLRGVEFNGQVSFSEDPKTGKRTYNGVFKAEQAKLK